VELVRLFQVELEHYEKIEGTLLSLDGKANRLAHDDPRQPGLAMQGLAVVPLFAGYDLDRRPGRIFSYDVTGGRYEEHDVPRGRVRVAVRPRLAEEAVATTWLDEADATGCASRRSTTPPTTTPPPVGRTWPADLAGGRGRRRRRLPRLADDEVGAVVESVVAAASNVPTARGPLLDLGREERSAVTMPFYVSPEQLMKDRADYARKGIARGRSVVVLQYADGILFVAENPSRALHKISEIYDRIAFAAVGKYNEFENLRVAGVRLADLRGYSYDRADVTGRAWPTPTPRPSARSSPPSPSPTRWRSSSPRSAPTPTDDQIYRLTYDGSVADEHGFAVMGGSAELIGSSPGGALPGGDGPVDEAPAARGRRARPRRRSGEPAHAHPDAARGRRARPRPAPTRVPRHPAPPDRRAAGRAIAPAGAECSAAYGGLVRVVSAWTGASSASRPSTASPARSAASAGCLPDEVARYLFRRVVSWGRSSNVFLRNGARLYLDVGSHPEYATPECDDITALVTHDKAGSGSSRGCSSTPSSACRGGHRGRRLPVQEQHRLGRQLLRLPRELPRRAARRVLPAGRRAHPVPGHAADHLRGGQGAADPARRGVLRQPARRAHLGGVSSATTRSRPIINTRDEPHADAERYRRLHVIVGDSNMSGDHHPAEGGLDRPGAADGRGGRGHARPRLENPIRAIREISHDPTGRRKVRLSNGRRPRPWRCRTSTSAGCATSWTRRAGTTRSVAHVLDLWERALKAVDSGDLSLVEREIDWVIKYRLHRALPPSTTCRWRSPRVAQLDLAYHDIHRDQGLYYLLQRRARSSAW
jgi:proteasome accessory factor A